MIFQSGMIAPKSVFRVPEELSLNSTPTPTFNFEKIQEDRREKGELLK